MERQGTASKRREENGKGTVREGNGRTGRVRGCNGKGMGSAREQQETEGQNLTKVEDRTRLAFPHTEIHLSESQCFYICPRCS